VVLVAPSPDKLERCSVRCHAWNIQVSPDCAATWPVGIGMRARGRPSRRVASLTSETTEHPSAGSEATPSCPLGSFGIAIALAGDTEFVSAPGAILGRVRSGAVFRSA